MPLSPRLVVAAVAGLLLIPLDATAATAGAPKLASPVQPVAPARPAAAAAVSPVTPEQIRSRAESWLTAWNGGPVPYLSSGDPSTWFQGYRRDCSGYVSMALGLAGPGLDTVHLAMSSVSTPITKYDLSFGDLMINPAPGADGHVVIFDHWVTPPSATNSGSYVGYEQSGSGGTHHRTIPYPYFNGYPMSPYRYKGIVRGVAGAPSVLKGSDGAMTAFVVGVDGRLYTSWQSAAGGSWSGWVPVGSGGPAFTGTPFARIHDTAGGAMTVFVTGTDGRVYTSWQPSPGASWVSFVPISNGTGLVSSPVVLTATGGAMTVFGTSADGKVYTAWQSAAGSTWSNWLPVGSGGPAFKGAPFALIHDPVGGAMTVFVTGADGKVYTSWQPSPGGTWVSYLPVGSGPAIASNPAEVTSANGAMSVFATGADSTVYTAWQTAPGSTFSSWTHL